MLNFYWVYLILEIFNYIYYNYIKSFILNNNYYYGNRFDLIVRNNFIQKNNNQIKFITEYINFKKTVNININEFNFNSICKFLLSLYFNKSLKQVDHKHLKIIYEDIIFISNKYKIKLNNKIKLYKYGKSDIKCFYKPIFISFLLTFIKYYYEIKLKLNGFNKYKSRHTNICYWYKMNKNKNIPLIFIHGLGFGIIPYLDYIIDISKEITIICPVLPNISNTYFHPFKFYFNKNDFFPNFNLINEELINILNIHKIKKINIMAHSFGTFILSSLMLSRKFRKRINLKIFVDPVCFHSNFIKTIKAVDLFKMNEKQKLISILLHYFIYLDIYVKYATKRNLFTMEFLWGNYKYLDNDTIIVLSENDNICGSFEIYDDINKYGFNHIIEWLPNANHGDLFLTDNWKNILLEIKNKLFISPPPKI